MNLAAKMNRAGSWVLLAGLRFYQIAFSPLMPIGCKFHPSCSHYAAEAIERYGAWRGGRLAAWRLLRCSPFTRGGFDPVPEVAADDVAADLAPERSAHATAAHVSESKVGA